MSTFAFLGHFVDPFQLTAPVFWYADSDGEPLSTTFEKLSAVTVPVVTYDSSRVVAAFRDAGVVPPQLVEIRDGLKLLSGRSKDQGGERHWNAFAAISRASSSDEPKVLGRLTAAKIPQLDAERTNEVVAAMVSALRTAWSELQVALELQGEWERFSTIEIPVQSIFRRREFLGIRVDTPKRDALLEAIRLEKYRAYRELAQQLGFSPSSLGFQNVGSHLIGTDAAHLAGYADSASFQQYIELSVDHSNFARCFLEFSDARRDESTIIKMGSIQERYFPTVECFGTVTGRIIITNPPIQMLKKKHRSLITADEGKVLLYFDYCQFEPGVLASLAGDASFAELYNNADVYSQLSEVLFGKRERRSEAKKIFLGYMYGMSPDALGKLLAGTADDSELAVSYRFSIKRFFDRFQQLLAYRLKTQTELETKGYIETVLGNKRIRITSGRLAPKEQHWALSQRIQGTASLIFKDALLRIETIVGADAILLPMHDAVLIQCSIAEREAQSEQIVEAMKATFRKWCPGITPRVAVESFSAK
jgi:DNA polymerase I